MAQTRVVHFNKLPVTVRTRLVQILTKGGDPTLVRFWPGSRPGPWVAAFFAVAGTIATLYTMQWLIHEDSRKDAWFDREIYLLLAGFGFVMAAGIAALVFHKLWPPPEFPTEAKILTGGYLIHVGRRDVSILTLDDTQPTITNVYRNGAYQHARLELGAYKQELTIYCGAQAEAEEILNALAKAKRVHRELVANRDENGLRELDPLASCTLNGVFEAPGEGGPTLSAPPAIANLGRWLGALGAGIVISLALFTVMKSRCANTPGCHSLRGR